MLRSGSHAVLPLAILLAAAPALSSDGVLEINQTCGTSTAGCFPGDAGASSPGNVDGFPVTITQSGSYRLTGSLSVPIDRSGIEVQAHLVSIDLGGFAIAGSNTCTGGFASAPEWGPNGAPFGPKPHATRAAGRRFSVVRAFSWPAFGIVEIGPRIP